MLKTAAAVLVVLTLAVAGGGGSVWYALGRMEGPVILRAGAWIAYPELGSVHADPYSKAAIARHAVLPLGPAEGIAFYAERDSFGARLNGQCTYRLEGAVPLSRLWTLHARTPLAPAQISHGVHSMAVIRNEDGSIEIAVGPTPMAGNWLNTDKLGELTLVLTLYDTPVAGRTGQGKITLPTIRLDHCQGRGPAPSPSDRQDGVT